MTSCSSDISVSSASKVLRSRIGTVVHSPSRSTILRAANSIENRQLWIRLNILKKDARSRVIVLNKEKVRIVGSIRRILDRSQKLVNMYNLPSIKCNSMDKVVPEYNRTKARPGPKATLLSEESRRQSEPVMSLSPPSETYNSSDSTCWVDSHQTVRRAMGSPVPRPYRNEEEGFENSTLDTNTLHHPQITIETCTDQKRAQARFSSRHLGSNVGGTIVRSKSASNLTVPSPMLMRRKKVSSSGSWKNLSSDDCQEIISSVDIHRSEGNLPLAVHLQRNALDPRFVALESILQPNPFRIARPSSSKSPCIRSRSVDGRSATPDRLPLLDKSSDTSSSPANREISPKIPIRLVPLRYNHKEV